ncbi:hypothetical protein STEG23_033197, partial [Scotinomys teguina]
AVICPMTGTVDDYQEREECRVLGKCWTASTRGFRALTILVALQLEVCPATFLYCEFQMTDRRPCLETFELSTLQGGLDNEEECCCIWQLDSEYCYS